MILTNWGDPVVKNDKSEFFSNTYNSFWIKIVMQWVSFLIYVLS